MKTRIISSKDMMLLDYAENVPLLKGDIIHLQEGKHVVTDRVFRMLYGEKPELDIIVTHEHDMP